VGRTTHIEVWIGEIRHNKPKVILLAQAFENCFFGVFEFYLEIQGKNYYGHGKSGVVKFFSYLCI